MKTIFTKLQRNSYFLGFVLLFAYVQSVQLRILSKEKITFYTFTPEAGIATFISVCILFVIIRCFLDYRPTEKPITTIEAIKILGYSLLLYVIIINLISLLIALGFDTFERNFNQKTFLYNNLSNFLQAFIYGSFFLAYYYYKQNKHGNEQLATYNQALSESKITQLKSQLNPHFLFNNLNVLDQLIEEDKIKASDFLNDFSEIYRYVLQTSDKKLVTLDDELEFTKSYFRLMQHKYGMSYILKIKENNTNKGFIPPLALQLLLENAIQHNLGNEEKPIEITIETGKNLIISNNVIEKKTSKTFGGRALENLKQQYRLLSNETIDIKHTSTLFTVILPIIPQQKI